MSTNTKRTREQQTRARKAKENPGVAKQNLRVNDKDSNYQYYWATEDQVNGFLESDYEVVDKSTDKTTAAKDSSVTSTLTVPSKSGSNHILMRKRKEWYEQDQAYAQEKVDKTEEAIYKNKNREGLYSEDKWNVNVKHNKKLSDLN